MKNKLIENESNDDSDIPEGYVFPSFMAFGLWCPFVKAEKISYLLIIDDAHKSTAKIRREKRKASVRTKDSKQEEYSSAVRGFSTDQRISIEVMNIQKELVQDRRRESMMIVLSIQLSSITSLLNQADIRASNRCPTYDKDNAHWKRVDNLIEEQDRVMNKLLNFDQNINMS